MVIGAFRNNQVYATKATRDPNKERYTRLKIDRVVIDWIDNRENSPVNVPKMNSPTPPARNSIPVPSNGDLGMTAFLLKTEPADQNNAAKRSAMTPRGLTS